MSVRSTPLAFLLCILLFQSVRANWPRSLGKSTSSPKRCSQKELAKYPRSSHLALLPPEHSPDSPEWRNSVAICTLVKAENGTDVREWLYYYRWLGVEHVYMTENDNKPSALLRKHIRDFEEDGFLTYSFDPSDGPQLRSYRKCMEDNYAKHNWLAFIDLDEILVLMDEPAMTLPEFLDEYKHYPGLSVHWVTVGPSGWDKRPQSGGSMRYYDHCAGVGDGQVKTIANTFYLSNIASNPHNFEFRRARELQNLK